MRTRKQDFTMKKKITFLMWFITALKIIPKQDYQKRSARWPQACSTSRTTDLKRFPTIHLLMDNLGHDFLKQSLTILLTYLFPSSFSNFSQFPLPLFLLQHNPRHQIMPSTHTDRSGGRIILFYFWPQHSQTTVRDYSIYFFSSTILGMGTKRGASHPDSRNSVP